MRKSCHRQVVFQLSGGLLCGDLVVRGVYITDVHGHRGDLPLPAKHP